MAKKKKVKKTGNTVSKIMEAAMFGAVGGVGMKKKKSSSTPSRKQIKRTATKRKIKKVVGKTIGIAQDAMIG